MDQQTKDEKEYLGVELFTILQERRRLVEAGELEDDPQIICEPQQPIQTRLAIKIDLKEDKDENF